jgi:pantetheine-phosphate adenylyltransferase
MAELHPHALFAGSFDPPTLGHYDLIRRGIELFGSLRIVVASHPKKASLFTAEQRIEMLQHDLGDLPIIVESHSGLLVEYAALHNVQILLRGLRSVTDFEYEYPMALTNRHLAKDIETVFVMPNAEYSHVSSSLVQEVYLNGGSVPDLVSPFVHDQLSKKK